MMRISRKSKKVLDPCITNLSPLLGDGGRNRCSDIPCLSTGPRDNPECIYRLPNRYFLSIKNNSLIADFEQVYPSWTKFWNSERMVGSTDAVMCPAFGKTTIRDLSRPNFSMFSFEAP